MFWCVYAVLPRRTPTQRVTPSYSVERGEGMGCPRFCTPVHRVKRCLRRLRREEYRNMLLYYDKLLENIGIIIVEVANAAERMAELARGRDDDYFFFAEAAETLENLVDFVRWALMYADLYAMELVSRLDGGCYPLIRDYVDEILDKLEPIANAAALMHEIENIFEWVEYQRLARNRGARAVKHAAELVRKVAAAYSDVIIEAGIKLLHDDRVIPAGELLDVKPEDVIEQYDERMLRLVFKQLFGHEKEDEDEEGGEV